jgi:adenine-specific DNA-methyltransferase
MPDFLLVDPALMQGSYPQLEPSPQKNKIIIGDNLPALEWLQQDYQNRVDLIYIDPPYGKNDGDLIFSDRLDNPTEWHDFMRPRLAASRELLTEDGICLVSMSDKRIHHLRLLLDEVFGEDNYVNTIIWYHSPMARHRELHLRNGAEYICAYAKDLHRIHLNPIPAEKLKFKNVIQTVRRLSRKLGFPLQEGLDALGIQVEPETGEYFEWYNTITKTRDYFQRPLDTLWTIGPVNRMSREYVTLNMGQKPRKLIEQAIQVFGHSEALILDYFAGTGTTGEAVIHLNQLDGGHRSYILVQSPETCKEPELIKRGYQTIPDILFTRMQKAVDQFGSKQGDSGYEVLMMPIGQPGASLVLDNLSAMVEQVE